METESFVVVVLALLVCYLTARSGKRGVALILLPSLVIVPLANLLASALAPRLDLLSASITANYWRVLIVLVALAVTMGLVGGISRNIKKKAARRTYMFLCGGFSLAFAFMIFVSILPSLTFR